MTKFIINGVTVTFDDKITNPTKTEAENYIDYVCDRMDYGSLKKIDVTAADNDTVILNYMILGEKFERIRRITG